MTDPRLGLILIAADAIQTCVRELARIIPRDHASRDLLLLCGLTCLSAQSEMR